MSSDFYGNPGYRVSKSELGKILDTVQPVKLTASTPNQAMFDELNRRLIDMENKLNSYASKVQTVEASNVALTEMVEYLKAVANGDI